MSGGGRRTGPIVEAIIRLLEEEGPTTRASIAARLGRDKNEVASVVSRLNRTLTRKPKRIYVSHYVYDDETSATKYPRAVYALGDKPDARKPPPKPDRVNQKNYRDRRKLRVSSVFDLGVSLRQRLRSKTTTTFHGGDTSGTTG